MAQIVIVDDDADIRELVALKLSRLEHDVRVASNGVDGLDLCREARPDVAIVDVTMPGMTGLELVARLRADEDPDLRATPVILLTAMATAADVDAGMLAGADDYVTKPFSPALLAERVTRLLGCEDELAG